MGITFAYELGLKSFLYEKSSTQKIIYSKNQHLQNPQKPNRTKDTGLLRSRVEKIEKITSQIWSNSGQTVVKQWSN